MRILHLMPDDALDEVHSCAVSTILGLRAEGVDVCAVLPSRNPHIPELVRAGVQVETSVLDSSWRFLQRRRMKEFLSSEKPALVHCWLREAATLVPTEWKGCPVVAWVGDSDDLKHYPACSHFVSTTEEGLARLTSAGAAPEKSARIPPFPVGSDQAPVDRATMKTQAGSFVVLSFLTAAEKAVIGVFVQAIKSFPDAILWLAGEESLRGKVEKQAAKFGLQERVRFLGPRMDRGALLRAADVCILLLILAP